ncbi:hypothetical protein EYF80_010569 [Liparis tanakae]|uniref:Uncharacterized protein n=1 Tax=Liparis tanakae TaxID=230148 RepID=A0A4Z2IMV4_9TELE|nr:hypothetical protein EYF80_010569 [Liparis tanakae]
MSDHSGRSGGKLTSGGKWAGPNICTVTPNGPAATHPALSVLSVLGCPSDSERTLGAVAFSLSPRGELSASACFHWEDLFSGSTSASKTNTTLNGTDTAAESGSEAQVERLIHRGGPEGTELLHRVT